MDKIEELKAYSNRITNWLKKIEDDPSRIRDVPEELLKAGLWALWGQQIKQIKLLEKGG